MSAQSGGFFPGEPFNGLQIEYSISGADLGSPQDQEGYTWYRNYDGTLSGNKLVVSGVAHASAGWGATLVVQLSADGAEPVAYTVNKFPENGLFPDPMEEAFSLSIDIPRGAESASFSISLTGEYNAGSRGVVVSGNLAGANSGASQGDDTLFPGDEEPAATTLPISGLLIPALIIGLLTALGVIGGGGLLVSRLLIPKQKPSAPPRPAPQPVVPDPEVAQSINAWQQLADRADLEAEEYIRQWNETVSSLDPSDPNFQNLQQQYQDYINYKRNEAAEARRKIQEIIETEQRYQQEVRQQQAYRQHRQAERKFIEQESQRQARRQGAFDRQMDQLVREQQQKLERLKAERKKYRDDWRKELIKARQAVDLATANQQIAAGNVYGAIEKTLQWIKWGADTTIDIIAQVAPGTKPVKIAYKFLAGTGEGVGEAMADKQNWKSHVVMGLKKGTVDAVVYVIKDKPLNYVPNFKGYVKPEWVKLPEGTKVLNVTGGEWAKGTGQALISKVRGKFNPIVHGGEYLTSLKF